MNRTVYFADKQVVFTSEPGAGNAYPVALADGERISRDKVVKILETHNSVAVVSPDPDAVFADFAAGFRYVEAAGGIVVNERGEWLMIHRNGRWDLPKGHLEPGEQIDACAVREISEETGIGAGVVRPLCETLHAYFFSRSGCWELKHTCWFELSARAGVPSPQTEEGIDAVAWCTPSQVAANLRDAFPTIRCVAAAMESERN